MKAFSLFAVVTKGDQKLLVLKDETSAADLAEALNVTPGDLTANVLGLKPGNVQPKGADKPVLTDDPETLITVAKSWMKKFLNDEKLSDKQLSNLLGAPKAAADFTEEDKAAVAADATYVPRDSKGFLFQLVPAFVESTKPWIAAHLGVEIGEVSGLFSGDYNDVVKSVDETIISFNTTEATPVETVDADALQEALNGNQEPVAEGVPAEDLVADDAADADETTEETETADAAAIDLPVEDDNAVTPVSETQVQTIGNRENLRQVAEGHKKIIAGATLILNGVEQSNDAILAMLSAETPVETAE